MALFVLGVLVSGLIIGALGRLVVPGPNPNGHRHDGPGRIGVSCWAASSVDFSSVAQAGSLLLAIAGAALIVWLIERCRSADAAS